MWKEPVLGPNVEDKKRSKVRTWKIGRPRNLALSPGQLSATTDGGMRGTARRR
jgi:hypothetical protein